MFPKENVDTKYSDRAATTLADQAFTTLVQTNLYNDELEKQKLTAAARAILSTINATSSIYDPSQIQTTTDIVSHLTFGVRIFRS